MTIQTEELNKVTALETTNTNKSSREFKIAALELLLETGLSKNKVSQLLGFSHTLWDYWEQTDQWFVKELASVKAKYGDSIRYRLSQFGKRNDKIGMVTNFFLGKAYCDEFADKRVKIDGNIQHNISFSGITQEPTPISIDKSKVIDVVSESLDSSTDTSSKLTLERSTKD